jgi:dockerin type I repeat protein
VDAVNNSADEIILIQYDCSYTPGDYNDDGLVNLGDALYLTEYIFKNGPAPVGGAGRADANGDSYIDISDVIYIVRHIYGGAPEPRY